MGFGSRAILAGGLGFTVAFVVACGNSTGLLSSAQKNELAANLHSVSAAVAAHNCAQAQSAASALNNSVAKLPQSVNPTLVQNLGQGAGTLSELAAQDCSPTSSSTPSSTSTSTTTSTTTTTPTTTTTSSTPTSTTPSTSSSTSSSATNPTSTGTTSTNGGVGVGGGTGTTGQGGNGQ
jgi:cell wall integrity and stress response component